MAGTFRVLGQREDIEFLGGTQTRAVVSVSYVALPSNTYFESRIIRKVYSSNVVKNVGEAWAALIQQALNTPGVADAAWSQIPTGSGELRDTITLTVESDSGNSTAELAFPFDHLVPEVIDAPIAKLRGQLNASEAL